MYACMCVGFIVIVFLRVASEWTGNITSAQSISSVMTDTNIGVFDVLSLLNVTAETTMLIYK